MSLLSMYPIFVYPILLLFLTKNKRISGRDELPETIHSNQFPFISFVISAYNEESVIRAKLESIKSIDYPKDKFEVILVLDYPNDKTESIAKAASYDFLKIFSLDERRGKTFCQNVGVANASGEAIFFTDANTIIDPQAPKRMVLRLLSSDDIGCVTGNLSYFKDEFSGEGKYQSLENLIKILETQLHSSIGANGGIYCIRKSDFIPLDETLLSDFVEPLEIYRRYKKVTYFEKDAYAFEQAPDSSNLIDIFHRKLRILVRSLHAMKYLRDLLNPFKFPLMAFEIISHKLIKWLSPMFVLIINILFLFTSKRFAVLFFVVEFVLVLFSIIGLIFFKNNKRPKFLYLLSYIFLVNLAGIVGWIYFILGKNITVWQVKREDPKNIKL
ncbi:MAG: glycosyltransferase [archaeon]